MPIGSTERSPAPKRDDEILFSESPTRFLVEIEPGRLADAKRMLDGLPFAVIGELNGSGRLVVNGLDGRTVVDESIAELHHAWASALDFGSSATQNDGGRA